MQRGLVRPIRGWNRRVETEIRAITKVTLSSRVLGQDGPSYVERAFARVCTGGFDDHRRLAEPREESQLQTVDLRLQYFDDTRNIVASDFVDQFSALGQPGRLKIFRLLVRAGPQGLCVEDIKQRVPMPGSTLSHHLDTLTRSGLMSAKRSSRFVYYAVDWDQTARLIRFLTEDCCADLHSGLWETHDERGRRAEPRSRSPHSRVSSSSKRKTE